MLAAVQSRAVGILLRRHAILRELTTKGDQARFVKTERGKFALKAQP